MGISMNCRGLAQATRHRAYDDLPGGDEDAERGRGGEGRRSGGRLERGIATI